MHNLTPDVFLHVLPGCIKPERKSKGAIGYDAGIRAIVSPFDVDEEKPYLRKTLFDFENTPDNLEIAGRVEIIKENGSKELVYNLLPGESVTAGLGFITAMPFPLFYLMVDRSSWASKHQLKVMNAPGAIDPDYRGEAGAVIKNWGDKIFKLKHNMRIVQCIFQYAIIPFFVDTPEYKNLPKTVRGAGGFGSTGI